MKNKEEAILQKTLHLDFAKEDTIGVSSQTTFWMEVVAVEAFGLSWLTKSELFLKG